jgi:tagatose-6-phosphate ketose/aldose isomerase
MNDSRELLGLSAAQICASGAHWTTREIAQQPEVWPKIASQVSSDAELAHFLQPLLANPALRIVLTGAGSSSYIGKCLAPALARARRLAEAIPTTDIVTDPAATIDRSAPMLMVHFARSGNSPESVAALELAERLVSDCHHLIVTCNAQGELHRRAAAMRHARSILLPEACNDQSFAMTSSFTGMLLAAALALHALPADGARIDAMIRAAHELLTKHLSLVASLVGAQFNRVVYLGSNELKGLALESALKMLELTDGKVVSLGESPVGFRHGPKTIVNGSTLVVAFLSSDEHTRRYDLDLVHELRTEAVAGRMIAVSARTETLENPDTLALGPAAAALTDLGLCLPYAVLAQMLALHRSVSLGLSPDTPNAAGTVSRVVQGVSIYPYTTRA